MRHFTLTRGHRSPQTQLLISERDAYLREARARFCGGMSERSAARVLHQRLSIYRNGRWRRERIEATLPARCHGLDALLWKLLKVRDAVPSVMTIRRSLFS